MDRIIEVKINGNYLTKDNDSAGVQREANVTQLKIEFDAGWDGYAKKVTWWDAKGNNPVERTLTADLLEDITVSTRIYLSPIPGEALAEAGRCTFVIDGYIEGKRQRSVSDTLKVKPAPFIEQAAEPVDPTPSQAEQLQGQIDTLLNDMAERATRAENAAVGAKASETAAAESAEQASSAAQVADSSKTAAEQYAQDALNSKNAAAVSESSAKVSEANAARSASNAAASEAAVKTNADNAKASETAAKTSETNASSSANAAAQSAQNASASLSAVASSAQSAASSANTAAQSATKAATSEKNAADSETAAKAAQAAAEKARDEAQDIAGGDFASTVYVDEKAATAESNANKYTDNKIAAIPTPDVSGQINAHNANTSAHSDIRTAVNNAVSTAQGYANTAESNANKYTDQKIAAIPTPDVSGQINTHNAATDAHSDIRTAVSNAASAASAAQSTADGAASAAASAQSTADGAASAAATAQNTADSKATMAEVNAAIAGITPASIGAAVESHTHTPASIGAVAANNNLVQLVNGSMVTLGGTAIDSGGSKMQLVSYAGSGGSGKNSACKVTFDFVPDVVRMIGFVNKATSSAVSVFHSVLAITLHQSSKNKTFVAQDTIICSMLTTAWKSTLGMNYGSEPSTSDTPWADSDLCGNTYAMKSADGKTISWYYTSGYGTPSIQQFNQSGYTYYVLGIKF